MKRHVAAVVVALTTLLVVDSHVDWVRLDGRPLVEVNGQRWDVHGWAAEQLLAFRRDCLPVRRWPIIGTTNSNSKENVDKPTALAVLSAIQQHSVPDSQSARFLQLQQLGDWIVAEVTFDTLKPTLVALRLAAGQWRVQDQAVWSGSTAPWHSGDFVRRYLRRQASDIPPVLLACVVVDPARYGAGSGGLGPVSAIGALP